MTTEDGDTLRTLLRSLPALAGPLPSFDPDDVPDDPEVLFGRWLRAAVDAGVHEPHAMTVATADADGRPTARVVILKDVRQGAWEFATDARSGKAADLAVNPRAAILFHWREQGRQVRLAGTAHPLGAEESAADFLARSPASRAAAFATRPGERLGSRDELERAMADALVRVAEDDRAVLPQWALYALVPDEAEFWQGDPRRAHTRVVYRRGGAGWDHGLVWP